MGRGGPFGKYGLAKTVDPSARRSIIHPPHHFQVWMALRWSVCGSLLVVLFLAGAALAQEGSRDDVSTRGGTIPDEARPPGAAPPEAPAVPHPERIQPDAGYVLLWADPCMTPSVGWDLRSPVEQAQIVPSREIAACAYLRDLFGLKHPLGGSEGRAEAAEEERDAPVLEGAGEAWARPARAQGRFWTGAALHVEGIAAQANLGLALVSEGPVAVEPQEEAQPAAFLEPPLPTFPRHSAGPVVFEEAEEASGLDPSEARGIVVEHREPTGVQGAVHFVRMGISRTDVQVERAAVAAFALLAAGFALYQRFTPDRSIEHECRARIYQLLTGHPEGATAGEVARLLGINRKTAEYHLNYLKRLGRLRTGSDESGARLYGLKAIPERKPLVERLLLLVRQRPGLSVQEAADALGVCRSSADRHAKALVVQGTLESRLVQGERRLFERAG